MTTHMDLWRLMTDDEKYDVVWWLDNTKWEVFNYAHMVEMDDKLDIEFLKMVDVARQGLDDLPQFCRNFLRLKAEDVLSGHLT